MPRRSSSSSVHTWPDRETVDKAVRAWARRRAAKRPQVLRVGYLGSYARGDWGVGSDVDLLIIVNDTERSFLERAVEWDATDLPVPADVLVYTESEWAAMREEDRRFVREAEQEGVWVWPEDRD